MNGAESLLRTLAIHYPSAKLSLARGMASLERPANATVYESLYDLASASDVLFSIGGDGTMLMAARAIERKQAHLVLCPKAIYGQRVG